MNQGDIVYLEDGTKAQFIVDVPAGVNAHPLVFVQPFILVESYDCGTEDVEEYETLGAPMVVSEVFPSPPRPVVDEEVAEARVEVEALRCQIDELRSKADATEREYRDRLKRLAVLNPLLEHIEDVVEGRITYFVHLGWGEPKITTFAEEMTLSDENDRHSKMRLLALYGRSNGELTWRVNHYSDGSGSDTDVIPCTSEDEAKTKLGEWLAKQIAERAGEQKTAIGLYRLLPAADKYGVPVPEKVRAWVTEYVVRQAQASVDDAQRALNERLRVLAQARGEV